MYAEELIGRKWTELRAEARAFASAASDPAAARAMAEGWYAHAAWEPRYYAVIALGELAGRDARALDLLHDRCAHDPSWQVNEALAMAFDRYCATVGYEAALPIITAWLCAPHANLRRAVSEGLRPWTARSRPYFAAHPEQAIALLGLLRDDESRYVQESAGNALRDVSRRHFALVLAALEEWAAELPESRARRTITRFALERAIKTDPSLRRLYE